MSQKNVGNESSVSRRTFLGAVGATALAVAASKVMTVAQTDSRLMGTSPGAFLLSDGWTMQSSADVQDKGDVLSQAGNTPGGKWYTVTVPCTVLAGLVANGEYPDIYYSNNLASVSPERFRNVSWWYRKEFTLPASEAGKQVWLYFKGINYRANVWLNGKQIGTTEQVIGCYADHELNITSGINASGPNTLAVEVFPPRAAAGGGRGGGGGGGGGRRGRGTTAPGAVAAGGAAPATRAGRGGRGGGGPAAGEPGGETAMSGDLAITFVDWAPGAPDQNMGIWQDVLIQTSGPVALRHPHIVTDLNIPTNTTAKLTVMADLTNATDQAVSGTLNGTIENITFSQAVTLNPHETKTVTFTPDAFAQLVVNNPRLWWPHTMGGQDRYDLNLSFKVGDAVSDSSTTRFGIRKVTQRMIDGTQPGPDNQQVLYAVNGVDVLVLGGGYAPDLLQRRTFPDRPMYQEDHIRYVVGMGLNSVRLEGKLEDDAFFDLCDRYGVLVLAGWCCCSEWERWQNWGQEQHDVAMASLRYQIQKLRAHPSLLVWLNGSDNPPPTEIETEYLAIEKELAWPCPTLSSAAKKNTVPTGVSGVKMLGPYQYVTPNYWLTNKTQGGAWGFNTEVGPGPQPPPIESIEKMIPPSHRWPVDDIWNFHCGRGGYANINVFYTAQDERFGPSTGLADFCWKAQGQAYETLKAMYEGFRRNKFKLATGEIQWMLNNAWPSMIWHLYDYYMRPGAAYAAVKSGCEPVHIMYSYDNSSINVVNDSLKPMENLTATATIYDVDSKQKFTNSTTVASPANSSIDAFTLPALPTDISTTYFLRLELHDADKKPVSINSYWLSTKADSLAAGRGGGGRRGAATRAGAVPAAPPAVSHADYVELEKLPKVKLDLDNFTVKQMGDEQEASIRVTNNSPSIALLVRLKLTKGAGGEEVLPIRWEDNYFMLLPNEQRQIAARYLSGDLGSPTPVISVDCYNNGRSA